MKDKFKVGDLVKYKGMPICYGVITQVDNKQIECLWDDGDLSWVYKKMVWVIV